jgi:hypothetical protein
MGSPFPPPRKAHPPMQGPALAMGLMGEDTSLLILPFMAVSSVGWLWSSGASPRGSGRWGGWVFGSECGPALTVCGFGDGACVGGELWLGKTCEVEVVMTGMWCAPSGVPTGCL